MKQKHYTDEQIAFALRQAEGGTAVAEICRKLGVSEPTFYRWKKQFAGMGTVEIRRLKQLEEEIAKLKRLVADLSLDKTMLQDVLRKNGEACQRRSKTRLAWRTRASARRRADLPQARSGGRLPDPRPMLRRACGMGRGQAAL
jgi:putative transposase